MRSILQQQTSVLGTLTRARLLLASLLYADSPSVSIQASNSATYHSDSDETNSNEKSSWSGHLRNCNWSERLSHRACSGDDDGTIGYIKKNMSNGVRVHGGGCRGDRSFHSTSLTERMYRKSPIARDEEGGKSGQWAFLRHRGYDVNPCKSQLHPSVTLEGIEPESGEELCVQEAYTPESVCFGCGPSAKDGLKLRSFRRINGMEASVTLDEKYCAFPGIINGGIISALFDCHGNWTAAMTLMDRGCLPKPPLTLTYEMLITYEEPTPPNEELIVRSRILEVKESDSVGSKATVHVELELLQKTSTPSAGHSGGEGGEKLLATGSGIFKKLGALRAL